MAYLAGKIADGIIIKDRFGSPGEHFDKRL